MGILVIFFANCRGLRQGDPASPALFNFVADAFSCILARATQCGHISPVVSYLLPDGVSHLQYADDTIIMVELDDACIVNLKFILLCFEAVSGLKINFSKSEVLVTGVDDAEALRVARLLNYSLGSFPFKYLGLPISPIMLHAKDFAPTIAKVGNRVLPWRGRYNTNAGKVALINSCLSSLPMFLMGFYLLSAGIHAGFDKHKGDFYWNAADNKQKYRLVKWQLMCRPKNLGGLGIINTLVMNKCLLIKWWWKIMTTGAESLWYSILKAKYFPHSNPMFASARRGSQFWKNLVIVRPIFWIMLNLSWVMVLRFVSGGICGVVIPLWRLGSRFCFRTVLSQTFPTQRWRIIIGIWLFAVPYLLKSWKTGKASLSSSLCSQSRRILLFGPIRPLAGFRSSRFTLGLSVAPPRIDFLMSRSPKCRLRLRSSFGKPLEAAFLRPTRFASAMVRARNSVTFVVLWKTRNTFFPLCVG